jgi:hypothetical protein
MLHEFGLYWLLILIPLLLPFLFLILNPAAFRQSSDQVVTREPGKRFLGAPKPVSTEAVKDLEFAWLSQSAGRIRWNCIQQRERLEIESAMVSAKNSR